MKLAARVFHSAGLLVAGKLIHGSLGLVSTLILARLLTPTDFGLVALVSITVYFFDVLSSAGSDQYIIRKESVSREDLNTAWTLDLLMKSSLWLVLLLLAPYVARFFDQSDLESALRFGSCVLPINALASAQLNILKQRLNYQGIFWLSVLQRLLAFVLVIGLALELKSYWAMIFADVAGSLFFMIGSYIVAPYRPRVTLVRLRTQWSFSAWMLMKGVVGYTRSQIDTLFVSKLFPAATLGQYHVARDVAMLPAYNLVVPASEPLVAMFRHSRNDSEQFVRHLRTALLITAALVLPVVTLLVVFPDLVITVLLGDRWTEAVPMLQVLSLLLLYFSFYTIYDKAMIASGHVRALFTIDLIGLLLIVIGLITVMKSTPVEIGLVRGVTGALNLLVIGVFVGRLMGDDRTLPVIGISTLVLLAVSASIPALVLTESLQGLPEILQLAIAGGVYAATYLAGIWLLILVHRQSELAQAVTALTKSRRSEGDSASAGSESGGGDS